jgi:GNAT superfamily N-acetyltransferase
VTGKTEKRILECFDAERRQLEFPYARREANERIVRQISLVRPRSMIVYSRHADQELSDAIHTEVEHFRSIGHDFEWKAYSHDLPSDLTSRLAEFGFEIGEEETVLVCEPQRVLDAISEPAHQVRRLTGPDEVDDYLNVIAQVWPETDSSDERELREQFLRHPEFIALYVAYVDGIPVGCSRSSFHPQSVFSGMWGGSVLPAYRGRGVYRSMIARRAEDALERGARYLQVDALPTSRPILERLGFEELTLTYPCEWRNPAAGAAATECHRLNHHD